MNIMAELLGCQPFDRHDVHGMYVPVCGMMFMACRCVCVCVCVARQLAAAAAAVLPPT
jgi:hypothetical protein